MVEKIRPVNKELKLQKKVLNTVLIFILGIVLGIFSKWLDELSINDAIWWQNILGYFDLGNVFSEFGVWIMLAIGISIYSSSPIRASLNVFLFFIGMTTSYHLYTIMFAGFNPSSYMHIWYTITFFTPILGFICWFSKGKGKISFIISVIIFMVMVRCSFIYGLWYFEFKSLIDTLFFFITFFILYQNPKKSIFSVIIALLLSFLFCILL